MTLQTIQAWLPYVPIAATVILFIIIVIAIARVFRNSDNDIQWADLVSALAHNGQQRGSWDAIGKGGGVILCMALPFTYVYSPNMDAVGLALVMGVALAYLGGVSAYAATLRARQGTVETVKTVEMTPVATVTQTRTETPPAATETK